MTQSDHMDRPDWGAPSSAARPADLVADQRRELELLSLLLRQEEAKTDRLRASCDWFARVHQVLAEQPRPSRWQTEAKRLEQQRELLKIAGLFDHDFYLRRYPDIAAIGRDPLDHYMKHGIHEGRLAVDPGDERANDPDR